MSNRPILSVTYKLGDQNHSVISVWPGKFPGTYSVSRDKGTEKYPAISIIDVLKNFAKGEGFVNVRVNSEADNGPRSSGNHGGGGGQDDYDDSFSGDVPF